MRNRRVKEGEASAGRRPASVEKRLVYTGGLLALAGFLLLFLAKKVPGMAGWYGRRVYPLLVNTVGRFFGIWHFSVVEWGLYLLAAGLFFGAVLLKKRVRLYLSGCMFAAGGLWFLYSAGCGVNYYREPFSSYLDMNGYEGAEEGDLEVLCAWLTVKTAEARETLELAGENGYLDLEEKGAAAMERLGVRYPVLSGYYPRPKGVMVSEILSVQQLSGIYSPFTVEANFNTDMTSYNIPHTICHELSHLRGFMREDEANFIGYLACLEAEDPAYTYSGYLVGWIYAGNALAGADPAAYARLYAALPDAVKEDLAENSAFWRRYDGPAAEAAERVNDMHLKARGQSEGVKTYGRVVDLMLWDFRYRSR